MRNIIMKACPSHEILGEEHGLHAGNPTDDPQEQGYRWVLDPIDGTKAFVTGIVHGTADHAKSTWSFVMHQLKSCTVHVSAWCHTCALSRLLSCLC